MKPGIPTLLAAASTFGVSVALAQTPSPGAQTPFAVPPYKNLKVLPKDITRPNLI